MNYGIVLCALFLKKLAVVMIPIVDEPIHVEMLSLNVSSSKVLI